MWGLVFCGETGRGICDADAVLHGAACEVGPAGLRDCYSAGEPGAFVRGLVFLGRRGAALATLTRCYMAVSVGPALPRDRVALARVVG